MASGRLSMPGRMLKIERLPHTKEKGNPPCDHCRLNKLPELGRIRNRRPIVYLCTIDSPFIRPTV